MKKKLAALFLALSMFLAGCSSMNQQTQTCTVVGKEAVRSGDGNQYRVYTEDCGTLSVEDSISVGRWDSADLYGTIKEGETYEVFTGGYRNGFLSMFPNILEAEQVSQ